MIGLLAVLLAGYAVCFPPGSPMNYRSFLIFCAFLVVVAAVVGHFDSSTSEVMHQTSPVRKANAPTSQEYQERKQRELDTVAGILVKFLDHTNEYSFFRMQPWPYDDCGKLADEIESDAKYFQSRRGDDIYVQAGRLEGIGVKLDKLITAIDAKKPEKGSKTEKELVELRIMTKALYERLSEFCHSLWRYTFHWERPVMIRSDLL